MIDMQTPSFCNIIQLHIHSACLLLAPRSAQLWLYRFGIYHIRDKCGKRNAATLCDFLSTPSRLRGESDTNSLRFDFGGGWIATRLYFMAVNLARDGFNSRRFHISILLRYCRASYPPLFPSLGVAGMADKTPFDQRAVGVQDKAGVGTGHPTSSAARTSAASSCVISPLNSAASNCFVILSSFLIRQILATRLRACTG